MSRLVHRAGALLGALAVAGAALAMAAPAASAHAALLFTAPAAGSAVPAPPERIVLTFDEPITLAGPPVILTDAAGHRFAVGTARQNGSRAVVTVAVAGRLPDGVYTVAWQVVSADGDPVSAAFTFATGPAPASLSAAGAAPPATPGRWWLAAARWVLFAALAMALGGLAGHALARRYSVSSPRPLPPPWALRASLAGLAAAVLLAVVQLGSGSPTSGLAHLSVSRLLLSNGPGAVAAAEMLGFAAAAVLLWCRRPSWAAAPLLTVVVAEGFRAHPESFAGAGGVLLTWAHLLPAALWAGMLFYTVRAAIAWRADPAAVRGLVRLYARAAAWLFALVIGTGVVSALVLVPLGDLFTTGYGRVLVIKAALVGAAAALALTGRLWLRRMPRPGAGPALATRLEAGTLAAVLAVAGLLAALSPPGQPGQPLPFPPPASGPVVPAGGRAGEVGIYGAASAGQIVLYLFTPDSGRDASGDDTAGQKQIPASLTLATPGGGVRALAARSCGAGCLVAPVRWTDGQNLLTVRAAPHGFTGGTATLAIPWPPQPGGTLLRRVAAVLRATPSLTVRERVTSDTSRGPGTPDQAMLSGSQFLATEPYEAGIAPVATQFRRAGGQVLLLGYPAQNIWIRLTISRGDRITAETLADPDHLITRTYTYPEK
jgi:copper transport protein